MLLRVMMLRNEVGCLFLFFVFVSNVVVFCIDFVSRMRFFMVFVNCFLLFFLIVIVLFLNFNYYSNLVLDGYKFMYIGSY